MRFYVICLIFISFMIKVKPEFILIEYVGESDKPIPSLLISKEVIIDQDKINFVVDDKTYKILKNTIETKTTFNRSNTFEFGNFDIKVCEKDTIHTYQFDRIKSLQLFDTIIKFLSKNHNYDELLFEIKTIRMRISY